MRRRQFVGGATASAIAAAAPASLLASPIMPMQGKSMTVHQDKVWPGTQWDIGSGSLSPKTVKALQARIAGEVVDKGVTRAIVVLHDGTLVAEAYADGFDSGSRFFSYSAAKSFTSAVIGILANKGLLTAEQAAPVPQWSAPGDPRGAITIADLLHMSSGIGSNEEHGDLSSDTANMLFGIGRHDVAAHAANHPLIYRPGSFWSYSNSTSNVLAGIAHRALGGGTETFRTFLQHELLAPLGMTSAVAGFDRSGCFVGSSLIWATARDYARFGLLYQREGRWRDKQILAPGWTRFTRTAAPASSNQYGAHFWLGPRSGIPALTGLWPDDAYNARGMAGQVISISPSRQTVVVVLGNTQSLTEEDDHKLRDRQIGEIYNQIANG